MTRSEYTQHADPAVRRRAAMLNDDLESRGLPRSAKPEQFVAMSVDVPQARILCDGDY